MKFDASAAHETGVQYQFSLTQDFAESLTIRSRNPKKTAQLIAFLNLEHGTPNPTVWARKIKIWYRKANLKPLSSRSPHLTVAAVVVAVKCTSHLLQHHLLRADEPDFDTDDM
jgi:hypothetical protein